MIFRLALRSLWNRRISAVLTICTIAISVALLLSVELIRTGARAGFAGTLSGTDLVVGARSGPVQLLLYSVFRIGDATANVSWESYTKIVAHPRVKWSIPLSLGDSYQGYRVVGTTDAYFTHLRYRGDQSLRFAEGRAFEDLYDAVLGAEVARALGYKLGAPMVLTHGTARVGLQQHDKQPFRVVGILHSTGTPVDRSVHVSLEAIEAIHLDWRGGVPPPRGREIDADTARQSDLQPTSITAFLLGIEPRTAVFQLQRGINTFREEPLLAILPGIALQQLWGLIGVAEQALLLVAACVVVAGLLGMLVSILTSLQERRREMAILRSVGARPWQIGMLLVSEAGFLASAGAALGVLSTAGLLFGLRPLLEDRFGLSLVLGAPTPLQWGLLIAVPIAGLLVGLIPALLAYRQSLVDGMTIRT